MKELGNYNPIGFSGATKHEATLPRPIVRIPANGTPFDLDFIATFSVPRIDYLSLGIDRREW